jgi:hypothetical protein
VTLKNEDLVGTKYKTHGVEHEVIATHDTLDDSVIVQEVETEEISVGNADIIRVLVRQEKALS